MSWSHPSQQEAQEAYDAAKQKYDQSAEDYLRASKLKEQYDTQASSIYKDYASDDGRLRRLKQLEFKLQRVSRLFGTGESGIQLDINLSRVNALEFSTALKESISCSGVKAPYMGKEASSPDIDYDADTSRAKELISAELTRVRELIETVDKNTKNAAELFNDLNRKASYYDNEMKECRKTMDRCTYEMEHYKKYL